MGLAGELPGRCQPAQGKPGGKLHERIHELRRAYIGAHHANVVSGQNRIFVAQVAQALRRRHGNGQTARRGRRGGVTAAHKRIDGSDHSNAPAADARSSLAPISQAKLNKAFIVVYIHRRNPVRSGAALTLRTRFAPE